MMCLLTRAIFVSAILLTVDAVCRAPTNYLTPTTNIFDDISGGLQNTSYVYTDTFINCSGCVIGLSACYRDRSEDPNSMAVFILNEQNTIVHVHNFVGQIDSSSENTVCSDYGSFRYCCMNQTLAENEQFVVDSSQHYGVWSEEGMQLHFYQEVPGHYIFLGPIEVGQNVNHTIIHTDSIEKMFFHLIINPGNCGMSSSSTESSPQPTSVTMTSSTNLGYSSSITTTQTTSNISSKSNTVTTQLLLLPTHSSQAVESNTLETSALSTAVSTSIPYTSTPLSSNMIETGTNTTVETLTIVLLGSVIGVLLAIGLILMFITILLIRSRCNSKTISKKTTLSQRSKGHSENDQEKTGQLGQAMDMDTNPAYASTSLSVIGGTTDEIYSYIPNEEDHMQSWTGMITTSQNEAYVTSLTVQQGITNEIQNTNGHNGLQNSRAKSDESDYVINSLVYDTAQEPFPTLPDDRSYKDNSDYVVNQLVYDTAANMEDKQCRPDIDMIVNEAYVVTNRH